VSLQEHRGTTAVAPHARVTVADVLALTKPGLTALSAATALGGAYLGASGTPSAFLLMNLAVGTLLVGAGAGTLNQWIERNADALMKRTEQRPLPSGKVTPLSAAVIGTVCALGGSLHLYYTTTPLAGLLALVILVTYLTLYTPLKRRTHLATAVGGIPGALPPVIGWVSVGRGFTIEAYLLFLFLFIWQMPHFLALAWMYRRDYERGGYRLLPHYDGSGYVTSRMVLLYAAALIPVGVALSATGLMGWVFLGGSLVAGGLFLATAVRFCRAITNDNARHVFLASLFYLSSVLALMLADRLLVGA
jgi:heme o synthase